MASRFELARVKVTDANTGVFEKYQFLFSEGDEEQVFYGDYFGPEDLDPKCAIRSLELENITLVPVEVFYPLVRLGWTRAGPDFASTRHFVKKPRLGNYDLDDTPELWPSTELAEEIEILETHKAHPHPSLPIYHGVLTSNDRVIGLVFDKCSKDLQEYVYENNYKVPEVRGDAILSSIQTVLVHLHSLGFVHGDVHPSNIMFGPDETPVLIDYDSYYKIGQKVIGKSGHWGWEKEEPRNAHPDDDWYAFGILKSYLRAPRSVEV